MSDESSSDDSGSTEVCIEDGEVVYQFLREVLEEPIGEDKYSEEQMHECDRLLVEYKRWSDPVNPGV